MTVVQVYVLEKWEKVRSESETGDQLKYESVLFACAEPLPNEDIPPILTGRHNAKRSLQFSNREGTLSRTTRTQFPKGKQHYIFQHDF
jgi:hypothetical protein